MFSFLLCMVLSFLSTGFRVGNKGGKGAEDERSSTDATKLVWALAVLPAEGGLRATAASHSAKSLAFESLSFEG